MFLKNNKGSLIFSVFLILAWLFLYWFNRGDDYTEEYIKIPSVKDIYIFKEDNTYAPMRLDSLTEDKYFMRNYLFYFEEAIPTKKQIKPNEFDTAFYAIYEKQEINRLYKANRLIKIYRN